MIGGMHKPRRTLLLSALAASLPAHRALAADADADAVRLLRQGGTVAVFRHALAPGTFDPPGMRLADCSTQRNLNSEGRTQARCLGAWFRGHGLQPAAVKSSPWCRCLDTAREAFGRAEAWPALGSPSGRTAADRDAQQLALRAALAGLRPGGFDVWVTHNFVIADLAGISASSGEGVVLRADGDGKVQLLARIAEP